MVKPVRYGFRSFDRQWIIPDNRLINQPSPMLWEIEGPKQVFITALARVELIHNQNATAAASATAER